MVTTEVAKAQYAVALSEEIFPGPTPMASALNQMGIKEHATLVLLDTNRLELFDNPPLVQKYV